MAKKFVPRGCGMLRNASLGCVLCCEIGPRGSWCVSVIGPGGVWCVSSLIMSTQVLCGSSFRELPTPIRVFGDKLLRIGVQIIFADSKKKNTRQKTKQNIKLAVCEMEKIGFRISMLCRRVESLYLSRR